MRLLAANDIHPRLCTPRYRLLSTPPEKDGAWNEAFDTGTRLPPSLYLQYQKYRQYFQMVAVPTYQVVMREKSSLRVR